MKKLLFLMLLMVIKVTSAGVGNNGLVTVENFWLWSNTFNDATIRLQTNDSYYYNYPGSCSDLDSYMVSSDLPIEVKQRIYTTLLSASMASRSVILTIDQHTYEQNRPKILNVIIN